MPTPTKAQLAAELEAARAHADALTRERAALAALVEAQRPITASLDPAESLRTIVDRAAAIAGETDARLYDSVRRELEERRGTEGALRESEERYRRLLEAVTDYTYQVRLQNGRPVETVHSPGCVRVTGYTPEELKRDRYLWIRMVDPIDRHAVEAYARALLAGEAPPPLEHRIVRKDGLRRWVRNTVVRQVDARGVPTAFDGLVQDVTERKEAEWALAEHAQRLETVRVVGAEIARELDLPAVLRLILQRGLALAGGTAGGIMLWDESAGMLVPQAWEGHREWFADVRWSLGEGVAGSVAAERRGMMVNDYRQSPYAHPLFLERTTISAVLAEPLLYRDRLLGVLIVDREGPARPFGRQDQAILELLADQAAAAIENARLHSASMRKGEELEALLRASRTVMAGLDLREILGRILKEAARISGAPHVKVLLVDEGAGLLRVGALQGSSMQADSTLPLGVGSSGIVAQTSEPLFMADAQNDPRSVFAEADRALGIVTYLGLPIKRGGEVLGVLTFNTTVPRSYTPEELAYLTSFADQAAIAIENARLYQTTHRRTQQLEALLRGVQSVMGGIDLESTLERIVSEAAIISECPRVRLFLIDHEKNTLRVATAHGDHNIGSEDNLPLAGTTLSGLTAVTAAPVFSADVRTDPRNPFAEANARTGARTHLSLPVRNGEEVLGVLTFNTLQPRTYSEDDLAYLGSFADQAALAIEKAQFIAKLQRSYEDLQRTQDELVRGEKLRGLGQMAAGIAHELNNILAAILGQVELLKLRTIEPQLRETLNILDTAATDGAQVVRRLQDFARQRPYAHPLPVRVAQVVREALDMTRPRWHDEALRRGVVVHVETEVADLPPILGSAGEVREALTNLILNAVDAMPDGGTIRLEGRLVPRGAGEAENRGIGEMAAPTLRDADAPIPAEGEWVEIGVADTGAGMTEEVRQQIFDPFFTTKGVRGTGLGLSVVYGIVERHGGTIQIASAPGAGTTVRLRFRPADREALLAPEAPPRRAVAVAPRRILLIDDDPTVREALSSLLRAVGHTVTEADGGAVGLATLTATPVDLVLTDLGMPEITGWDVVRAVKAERPTLPVILLTGWGNHVEDEAGGRALADRILGKPVGLDDLLSVIAELTGGC